MQPHEAEAYRLYARLPVHRRRVERAKAIVRDAVARVPGRWGVGLSGGKDSVALAHIACAAGWDGPFFHYHAPEIPEENTMTALAVGRRLNREVVTALIAGDWDLWEREGRAIVSAETDHDRRSLARHDRAYRAGISDAVEAAALDGLFWGMRKDESARRRAVIRTKGTLYRAASRQEWTCHPLADWAGRDVWAYLLAHDLPWLATYDHAEDREHERSETTYIFGPGGDGIWASGQGQRLRQNNPALWARLCARWPELRVYG
ncbi:MAG: phosphoadenosine phosphosulfate reductase family protein [Amaricoccus sp.]